MERAWNHFKLANNITTRQQDYEARYKETIRTQFPSVWSSFRAYEATRFTYNFLAKHDCLSELRTFMSDHCDFLNHALNSENTIFTMREVINGVSPVFHALCEQEKRTLVLEECSLTTLKHILCYVPFVHCMRLYEVVDHGAPARVS